MKYYIVGNDIQQQYMCIYDYFTTNIHCSALYLNPTNGTTDQVQY